MATQPYNLTNVLYARVTPNNTVLAKSSTGGTVESDVEEVIAPPFLASGKITTQVGSSTVIGTGTDFRIQFETGQFLYYFDSIGNATLLGEIENIVTDTQMVLKDDAISAVTLKNAGGSKNKLSGGENIYIRVPVVPRSFAQGSLVVTSAFIPNMYEWRINNFTSVSSLNNPNSSSLTRYSNPGDPSSIDTTSTATQKNVPFTIELMTPFAPNRNNPNAIINYGDIPLYVWYLLNPYGSSGENLIQKTMYNLSTSFSFTKGGVIFPGMTAAEFFSYGYDNSNIK